jgi:hypothetical protein
MAKKIKLTTEQKIVALQIVRSIIETDQTLANITNRDVRKYKTILDYVNKTINKYVDEVLPF